MKLSIITINYNNREGLKKTVASVMAQTWRDFKWIIIDGGSTDGSKELIEDLITNTDSNISYWCSEPDNGVYNAMNKGIVRGSSEYLLFLNSGDSFVDDKVIYDFYNLGHNEDIIAGDILVDGVVNENYINPEDNDLDLEFLIKRSITHPSAFIKASLFHQIGLYDEGYKIVSDWKFFLQATIMYSCTYFHWHRFVSDFNSGGMSESPENIKLISQERKRVKQEIMHRAFKTIERKNNIILKLDLPIAILIKQRIYKKISKLFHICDGR